MRRLASGLKRAGTLQIGGKPGVPYSGPQSPSPTNAEEDDNESVRADEDSYFAGGHYPGSPIGHSSPWNTPGIAGDWRAPGSGNSTVYNNSGSAAIDDVSRALSTLEISQQYGSIQQGQSAHPPRFNPSQPPPNQVPGMRSGNGNGSRKLQLVTDLEGRNNQGVQSASAYVPPIGHGLAQPVAQQVPEQQQQQQHHRDRAFTASGGSPWDNKERLLVGRASNPNLQQLYQQGKMDNQGIPSVPSIPLQYLNQGQSPRMGMSGNGNGMTNQGGNQAQAGADGFSSGTPIDVPTLIATKGYNPVDFDTRPAFVSSASLSLIHWS